MARNTQAAGYQFRFMEHTIFPQGTSPHMTVVYHLHRGSTFTGIDGHVTTSVPETQDWTEIQQIGTSAVKALETEFHAAGITDDDSAEAWINAHHTLSDSK